MITTKLFKSVTPLWDTAMGERLATARMEMLLTQAALGALLGVSQRAVCNMEKGIMPRKGASLAVFQDVLGDRLFFVLYGAGKSKHPRGKARTNYIHHVFSKQGPGKKKEPKQGDSLTK